VIAAKSLARDFFARPGPLRAGCGKEIERMAVFAGSVPAAIFRLFFQKKKKKRVLGGACDVCRGWELVRKGCRRCATMPDDCGVRVTRPAGPAVCWSAQNRKSRSCGLRSSEGSWQPPSRAAQKTRERHRHSSTNGPLRLGRAGVRGGSDAASSHELAAPRPHGCERIDILGAECCGSFDFLQKRLVYAMKRS